MLIFHLHCTSLGVVKQLLKLWFHPKYSSEPFSLSTSVNDINRLLKGLKLPHFVERLPEDVTKPHFWKASLCRNFLLYIGLAVLKPFMKPEYFKNFSDLVNGVSILHQASISFTDIPLADKYLNKFSQDFQTLYGFPHMSANIHLLLHLAASVLECGNLCITHCFKLEDLNGKLANLVHGTSHATKQIFSNLHVVTQLPLQIANVNCQEVKMFCNKIVFRKYLKFIEKIDDYIHVVGTFDYANVHHDDINELLLVMFGGYEVKFCTFPRVFKNGTLYVCSSQGSRISSYCKYLSEGIVCHGQLLSFLKVCVDPDPAQYYAYLSKSDNIPVEDMRRYFNFTTVQNVTELVPVQNLLCVTCLDVRGTKFLVDPLNKFEME